MLAVCWALHWQHYLYCLTPSSQTLCREYHFQERNQSSGDVMWLVWSESLIFSFVYNELDIHDWTKVPCISHQDTQETSTHLSIQKWGGQDLLRAYPRESVRLPRFPHLINSELPDLKIFLPAKEYCLSGWNAEFSELFIVFQNSCSVHQIDFQKRELRSETRTSY